MLLESLRAQTRVLNAQLEEASWIQPLLTNKLTIENYQTYLQKMYEGFLPFEVLLLRYLQQEDMLGYLPFAPAIQQDLWSIQMKELPSVVPLREMEQACEDQAFRVGARYVLESSVMMGPTIWRNLRDTLELPEDAASFLRSGYREPERWVKFTSLLFDLSGRVDADKAVAGAKTVLRHFLKLSPPATALPKTAAERPKTT